MTGRRTHNPNGVETVPVVAMKRCPTCGVVKEITNFYLRSNGHGRLWQCDSCQVTFSIAWRNNNRDRYRETRREYKRRKRAEAKAWANDAKVWDGPPIRVR